jgi:hypothetical protein
MTMKINLNDCIDCSLCIRYFDLGQSWTLPSLLSPVWDNGVPSMVETFGIVTRRDAFFFLRSLLNSSFYFLHDVKASLQKSPSFFEMLCSATLQRWSFSEKTNFFSFNNIPLLANTQAAP